LAKVMVLPLQIVTVPATATGFELKLALGACPNVTKAMNTPAKKVSI